MLTTAARVTQADSYGRCQRGGDSAQARPGRPTLRSTRLRPPVGSPVEVGLAVLVGLRG